MYCEKCGKELQHGEKCQCERTKKTEYTKKSLLQAVKKMIKILLWIMIVFTLLSGLGVQSGIGNVRDSVLEIMSYYVNILLIFVIPLLVIMNFMGIRNRLPLFRKKKFIVNIVAFFLLSILLLVIDAVALTIIDGMYSVEYQAEYEKRQEELVKETEDNTLQNIDEKKTDIKEQAASEEKTENQVEETELNQEEILSFAGDGNLAINTELENPEELSVYSMDYLAQYIEDNKIDFPKERYKSKIKKALDDDSEMIAVEVSGDEKVRYSATVGSSDFYYVGKLKNNVPDGWGKIVRVVTAYESEYEGHLIANIDTIGWGWSEDELVPLLVYVGEFEDGYYSGYGWKYADHFESKERYVREIGYDYARYSDDIMENILMNCNPIEYMGEFKKSLYDGEGILISYGAREIPYYMTDEEQMDLLGVVADKEIEFYVGEFIKNTLRGEAKHYLLGKLLYEGEYRDWNYDGTGTLYYLGTTKKKYEGEWKNDKYHGKGTLYNEDGSVKYKGKWTMGDYAN